MDSKNTPLRFPQDLLRFLYWVFFKPITLHTYLYERDDSLRGSDDPSLWALWRRRRQQPEFIPVIQLALLNILLLPWLAFPLAYLFQLAGFPVNWLGVARGVVAYGVAGGVALGVALGVAYSVVVGVGVGVALGVGVGVALGVAEGVAVGVAGGVAFGVAFGVAEGVGFGVTLGVAVGVAVGVVFGVADGVALGVGFILGYYRLILYPFEAALSWLQSRFWSRGLRYSPICWDELIWLPLPGLDRLLVKTALADRQAGMEALAFVAASFRQGWAAKKALLELLAYDIDQARTLEQIAELPKSLNWLPDDARLELSELLLGLEQISQHALAALKSETLYNRQEQLRMGVAVIERVRGGLAYSERSALAQQLSPALENWQRIFRAALSAANQQESIPNVYVSGSPLIKESKTFKGRRDLFRLLNNELVSPSQQRTPLLLFGARRTGKTSTLKQLPVRLGPQIVPVFIDLQKISTVKDEVGLLALLAKEIIKSAQLERHLKLPLLSHQELESDPYYTFQEWLSELSEKLGDYYWVLLALDEFEYLGEMLDAGRVDERIFQLLRGIIQNHPRITVLLSGAHTLEELPAFWSDYFINTKTLKVGPLAKEDALELITRPIPNFPLHYAEEALQLLLAETGLHPNWMQFTCREVIDCLNEVERFHVQPADVRRALEKVPAVLAGDFKFLWEGRDSTELMRAILKEIAAGQPLPARALADKYHEEPAFQKTLNFILRRDILLLEDGAYRFRAKLLQRWIAQKR